MFNTTQQFLDIWKQETESTLSCLRNLTDESLSLELLKDYRTIGRIANHIVDCAISIPGYATLPVTYTKQYYPHVKDLVDAYTTAADKVTRAIASWTDETLQETTPMYGEVWTKGFALWVTVVHQAHHRGQLTVLMRMAGLKVPGVCGPAREEWEAMGLPQAD